MYRGYTQGSASYRWLAQGFVVPPLWGLSQGNDFSDSLLNKSLIPGAFAR